MVRSVLLNINASFSKGKKSSIVGNDCSLFRIAVFVVLIWTQILTPDSRFGTDTVGETHCEGSLISSITSAFSNSASCFWIGARKTKWTQRNGWINGVIALSVGNSWSFYLRRYWNRIFLNNNKKGVKKKFCKHDKNTTTQKQSFANMMKTRVHISPLSTGFHENRFCLPILHYYEKSPLSSSETSPLGNCCAECATEDLIMKHYRHALHTIGVLYELRGLISVLSLFANSV